MSRRDWSDYFKRYGHEPTYGQCNGGRGFGELVICRVDGCSDSEPQFYHRICIAAHRAYYHEAIRV